MYRGFCGGRQNNDHRTAISSVRRYVCSVIGAAQRNERTWLEQSKSKKEAAMSSPTWTAKSGRASRQGCACFSHRRSHSRAAAHSGWCRPHLEDRPAKKFPSATRATFRPFHRTGHAIPDAAWPRCRDRHKAHATLPALGPPTCRGRGVSTGRWRDGSPAPRLWETSESVMQIS